MEYKTICEKATAEFTVKKSRFIGYVAPVTTEEAARDFINEIKALHRKANHNCHAYVLRENNTSRHSDDGEPSGTGGLPIFEVISKTELTDIVCVVTRYFGGIMLGAGGLVRAYGKGASIAIETASVKIVAVAEKIHIQISYPLYGIIGGLLKSPQYDIYILEEIFSDKVDIYLNIREHLADSFISELVDLSNGGADVKKCGKSYFDFSQKHEI